ncbi:MAG: DUF1080 domain-containing protein [Pedobacter sp.]|nr:MAG: DUF1080 domain-containing protein [Pedobacter sp.]
MKKILTVAAGLMLLGATSFAQQPNTLTKKEIKAGWKLLFDGKTTKGWHTYLRDTVGSKWQVQDGAIVFDQTKPRKGGGDLVTNEEFENYELNLEWKISKGGNSGIIFDIQEDPKYPYTWMTGPEMQVLDNIDADDNKKENHLAGCLYDMSGDATVSKPVPVGEWNKVRLIQNKGNLTFYLNNIKTFEGKIGSEQWNTLIANSKFKGDMFKSFAKVAKGKIALQEHPGSSQWRNIKIRQL